MDLPMIWPESARVNEAKNICIIGAGPSGLAALKVALETPQYKSGQWKVTVYEARNGVGGVWLPSSPTDNPPLTPLYDSLTTNIPHPVMAFTSYPFPPSTPVFPHASIVQKYLEDYANHFALIPHIQFGIAVEMVEYESFRWKIRLSDGKSENFDLVMICNGHFRVPRYPNTPGITRWLDAGMASHSAWYRHPRDLGDVVLVVGAGPSGQDISTEMQSTARTVIHSVTNGVREDIGNLKRRGRIAEFGKDAEVLFEDGTTESGINHCILATGYEYSYPFLSKDLIQLQYPPPAPPLPKNLYNSTYHVFPLAKHLFPLQTTFPPTSLAFMELLVKVVPFPLAEAQAHAVVQAFANPEILNVTQEAVDIMTRYEDLRSEFGDEQLIAKAWHKFKPHEQFEYRDNLHEFAATIGAPEHVKVPEWEKEMYINKSILRKTWNELVARGEAEAWVRGVGEGGMQEWVDLLRKMMKWAKERGIEVRELDKSKL